jgi:nitrite reductase (cytochrome c-552)
MAGVVLLGLLAAVVTEKRSEVASIFNNKVEDIKGIEPKSERWGKNYPREYQTFKQTSEMNFKSKYLGNMPEDILEARPDMVILWAGYAFARDYRAPRGHWYTIEDMRATLRVGSPGVGDSKDLQPATCWTCKSPDVLRMMEKMGVAEYYKAPWSSLGSEIVNPIGCADCHDPETMELTITRPGVIEYYQRTGGDVKNATIGEMRSLVCAQCHVEYYFKGDGKYLTLPWDKGLKAEDMEAYYDELEYSDFVNAVSKTPIIKTQHPDYELFLMGPHGEKGLSCADCHMPYVSDGGVKYSNHHLVSPLKDISASCQVCHRDSEETLRNLVYERFDSIVELRSRLEPELAKAHILVKIAMENGATDEELAPVRKLIRAAQWRWDFVVASHGAAFHAPLESARVLSHGIDKTFQAQLLANEILFKHGVTEFDLPDISTKEKAQSYIGLDMPLLEAQKAEFMKTVVPKWIETAKANGRI